MWMYHCPYISHSHSHWKLSKDQAVVWGDFQMRSVKIVKCTPRGWCPAEADQITPQCTPGMQILHTIKHVSDAQKDVNLQPGFPTAGKGSQSQREQPPAGFAGDCSMAAASRATESPAPEGAPLWLIVTAAAGSLSVTASQTA